MKFMELLTALFIGLKLTGYVAWNWFLVLCPLIIPIAFASLLLMVVINDSSLMEHRKKSKKPVKCDGKGAKNGKKRKQK